jgi:hypothetical protein
VKLFKNKIQMEGPAAPVFISTSDLASLLGEKSVKLFDATTFMSAEEGDPILSYRSKYIPGYNSRS